MKTPENLKNDIVTPLSMGRCPYSQKSDFLSEWWKVKYINYRRDPNVSNAVSVSAAEWSCEL